MNLWIQPWGTRLGMILNLEKRPIVLRYEITNHPSSMGSIAFSSGRKQGRTATMEHGDQATATTATAPATAEAGKGSVTLLIENPGKGKNWGPLLRCCAAFGIGTIFVVGYDRCDVRGSHGASKHVQLKAFPTHEQAASALKSGGFELVGLLSPFPDRGESIDNDNDNDDGAREVVRETFLHVPTETEMDVVRIVEAGAPASPDGPCNEPKNTEPQPPVHSETTNTGAGDGALPSPVHPAPLRDRRSFPAHRSGDLPARTCLVVDKLRRGLPWSLAKHCGSFVHVPHANYQARDTGGSMLTLEASVSIVFHELLGCETPRRGYSGEDSWASGGAGDPSSSSPSSSGYEGQKYNVERVYKGGDPGDERARQRKRKEREEKLRELQTEAEEPRPSLFGADTNDDGDY
ncbi:unnamed protein product [Pseudo-nitzschia multistriata]|uniref:tRNA/rRNA methyltransferase SpoU type domain-containing protein n=1 Tax=Pseudo-nitzschia multistriata TaxID=183589 RepID=A0A448ZR06_9STRA|nr:unnamed protein product [Pseudo-nitzschia multistriata]